MTDLRYGPMPPSAEMYALAQARAKRILEGSRIAPPTVTCRCGVTTDTPASTGWHWSAVQEAWSCPQCGVEPTPESYARGYALGVAYEHAGILEPEGGFPEDPLFTRGIAHGRADYRERVGSLMMPRREQRRPRPPDELVGALQDRVCTDGRLLAATPVGGTR